MDVTSVVTYLTGSVTPAVVTLGGATLLLFVGIKGWKMIRRAV